MRSATFRNIALGILALMLAYHVGARSATAQAPGNPIVAMAWHQYGAALWAMTSNGDAYDKMQPQDPGPWQLGSSVFGGGPVPARSETWGAMKSRYRGERGAALPTTQDR